jgi:aldehyde:ferredoxin oxidoreductase
VGITDLDAVIAADRLADELGLDTISAREWRSALPWSCMPKGDSSNPEDAGGLDLSFGNAETLMTLLHQMAYRKRTWARC